MLRRACLLSLLVAVPVASAGEKALRPKERREEIGLKRWAVLLPGGGQFLLGQDLRGAGYALGTAGLLGWSIAANQRKASGELNAPLVYTQQVYAMSVYESYRDFRLRAGQVDKLDPAPLKDLVKAPFKKEQLRSPYVLGSLAVGAGVNWLEASLRRGRRAWQHVGRVSYLGGDYNRDWGTVAYSGYWIPLSFGAGVAEESIFRGAFQSEFEQRWGQGPGLTAASGLFGIAHLQRLNSGDSWQNVGFATLAGLFLGWRYDATGYKLAQPIACHFWFDLAGGLTLFFVDPGNNPLGTKVQFAF